MTEFRLDSTDGGLQPYYEKLVANGFTFRTREEKAPHWRTAQTIYYINVETMDDLLKLIKTVDCHVIVNTESYKEDNVPEIEIYDGWRE